MFSPSRQLPRSISTLCVPDALRRGTNGVEVLFNALSALPDAKRYVFDMSNVTFIEPCGVIALLSTARQCVVQTGEKVLIRNISEQFYLYLHRMDFFRIAEAWLKPLTPLNEEWSRNSQTTNLLELTPITGYDDVINVLERAHGIFAPWLSAEELSNLKSVISELCQNIYQHSGDIHGCVLIQKYQPDGQNRVSICLAVGDSGCGIRASLSKRHRGLGDEPLDFIRGAMDGNRTSRPHGRGGLGLRTVRDIAIAHDGYVSVRSEMASVTDWGKSRIYSSSNLTNISGTQVSVKMCATISC